MGLTVLSVLLPVIVILALMVRFEDVVSRKATKELDQLATVNVGQIARDVYGICEISHDLIQQKINQDLVIARETLEEKGRIRLGATPVRWETTNQFTGVKGTVVLPRFVAGKIWLRENGNPETPTPMVDDVKRLVGGTCTIFQRMNGRGDMLRVASNMVGADGKRTIGTYIPADNPDGAPNPIVKNILQGQSYRSLAYLMNSWYLTAYEPLRNKKEDIIGMLYVGEKLEAVASLRKTIANMQVGKSGEVGIIGTKGRYQGRYIISKESAKDGADIWNAKDATGGYFVQSAVRKALDQPRGKVVYENFSLKETGESRPQKKIAAVMYFEPYDWLIFASAAEDDFYSSVYRMDDSIRRLLLEIVVVGSCFLVLAIVIALFLGKEVTKLLHFMTNLAKNIATGDLRKVKQDLATEFQKRGRKTGRKGGKDETEVLLGAFSVMTDRLDSSFRRLHRSVVPVNSPAAKKVLPGSAVSETANTPVNNSEIPPIAEEMVKEISKVASHLNLTIGEAQSSRKDLTEMENNMRGLSGVTAGLYSRFTVINNQADQISEGVTAMNAISEQANLLALNASITAEKAGKLGKGFTLVAREAGRLSNQTEAAAQRIGGIVKEIQEATSSGLVDSDLLSTAVLKTVNTVATVGDRIGMVVDHLQAHDFRLDNIKKGFNNRSVEEMQVGEAISRLSAVSSQTKASLHRFRGSMDSLNHTVDALQGELSGKGFPVVAREIRQMADQTVTAAQDIDEIVKELYTLWSSGVMHTEESGGEIRKRVEKVDKISEQLCLLIDLLRTYNFEGERISKGLDDDSGEAKPIDDAMSHLSAASTQARESLQEFRTATESLVHAFGGLPEAPADHIILKS
jgi:methyl-accepting chemotaxis protein